MKNGRKLILVLSTSAILGGLYWILPTLFGRPSRDALLNVMVANETANSMYVRILILNPEIEADSSSSEAMPRDRSTSGVLRSYETRTFEIDLAGAPAKPLLAAYAQTIPVHDQESMYALQFFTDPLEPNPNGEHFVVEGNTAIVFGKRHLRSMRELVSQDQDPRVP